MFIPSGYKVDLGNGEWLDNCKTDKCRLATLPDVALMEGRDAYR